MCFRRFPPAEGRQVRHLRLPPKEVAQDQVRRIDIGDVGHRTGRPEESTIRSARTNSSGLRPGDSISRRVARNPSLSTNRSSHGWNLAGSRARTASTPHLISHWLSPFPCLCTGALTNSMRSASWGDSAIVPLSGDRCAFRSSSKGRSS